MVYIPASIISLILLFAVLYSRHSEKERDRKEFITIRYRKDGIGRMDHVVQSFMRDYGFSEDFFQDEFVDRALDNAIFEYRQAHPIEHDRFEPDGINIIEYK